MQRTAQLIADHEPFYERSAVMWAMRRNRKEFISPPRENHIFPSSLPLNHCAIGKLVNRNTLTEIWLALRFHCGSGSF